MEKFLNLEGLQYVMEHIKGELDGKQEKLAGAPGQLAGFRAEGLEAITVDAGDNIELKQDGARLTVSAAVRQPNLLDNWYFLNPVNQRGQTIYTGEGYTIDRWQSWGSVKALLSGDGLLLSMPNGEGHFQQYLNKDAGWLRGKQLTLSSLTQDGLYSVSFTVPATAYIRTAENVIISLIVQETGLPYVRISNSEGDVVRNCNIKAVKLELGPSQTLARQVANGKWVLNDPPPDTAQELAKCQQYYKIIENVSVTVGNSIQNGRYLTGSVGLGNMRAKPAASLGTIDGHVGVIHGVQYLKPSELGFVSIEESNVTLYIPTTAAAGTAVAGKTASIYKIMLDANL